MRAFLHRVSGDDAGLQEASLGMQNLMLRVLDPPSPSSEDEQEGTSSRSDTESARPQKKLHRGLGRMKRTASAPAPPLLNMLSRTGIWPA